MKNYCVFALQKIIFLYFCPILFKLQGLLDIAKKTPSVQTRRSNSIFWPLGAHFNFDGFCQKWVSDQKINFFNFIRSYSNYTVLKLLVR